MDLGEQSQQAPAGQPVEMPLRKSPNWIALNVGPNEVADCRADNAERNQEPHCAARLQEQKESRPEEVELLLDGQAPKVARVETSSEVVAKEQNAAKHIMSAGYLECRNEQEVSPCHGHEAEEPAQVEALQSLISEEIRSNQIAAQNKEQGHAVNTCALPRMKAVLNRNKQVTVEYQQDRDTSDSIKGRYSHQLRQPASRFRPVASERILPSGDADGDGQANSPCDQGGDGNGRNNQNLRKFHDRHLSEPRSRSARLMAIVPTPSVYEQATKEGNY